MPTSSRRGGGVTRRTALALTGSAIAGAAAGTSFWSALSGPALAQAPTIRLAHNVSMVSSPIVVATRLGMFSGAKLNVEAKAFPSGRTMVTALTGGSMDIAQGIADQPPVLAWARGLDFRLLDSLWNGLTGFFVRADSDADSVAALKGKIIGIPLGTGIEVQARTELRNAGLKDDDYQAVNIEMQNLVATIVAKRVDGIAASFPQPYVAVARGQLKLLQSFGASQAQLTVTLSPKDFVEKNKDAIITFNKVMYDASKLVADKDPKAVKALVDHYKEQGFDFNAETMGQLMTPPNLTLNLGPGKTAEDRLTEVAKQLLSQKKIDAIPDIGKFMEPELWKKATGADPA